MGNRSARGKPALSTRQTSLRLIPLQLLPYVVLFSPEHRVSTLCKPPRRHASRLITSVRLCLCTKPPSCAMARDWGRWGETPALARFLHLSSAYPSPLSCHSRYRGEITLNKIEKKLRA